MASSLKSAWSRFPSCQTTAMFRIGLRRGARGRNYSNVPRRRKRHHRRARTTHWSAPPISPPERWTGCGQVIFLRGSLELLTGLPGMGKSQVHCQFVASTTTGRAWPDGTNGIPAGNVIMMTAEDSLDQIWSPA